MGVEEVWDTLWKGWSSCRSVDADPTPPGAS